ncbi:MAG TPA: amino acid adenylation domain-containing protein [Pyrinomonadaceae bacterium]|nr:amino acid adenylation domain-containing protein [Pyrinomonadaceae bacterium]
MQKLTIEGFRLSPPQQHVWSAQQTTGSAYAAQCSVLVEGALAEQLLAAAIQDVVQKHEILRTNFHYLPGMLTPLQVLADRREVQLQTRDLSGISSAAQEMEVESLWAAAGHRGFEWEHGALLRATLLRLAADRHLLLLTLPSLCADRTGLQNLVGEIVNAYERRAGGGVEASGEPLQYVDLSEWLNELLEKEDTELGRQHWRQQDLSALNEINLPFGRTPSEGGGFAPQKFCTTIDANLTARIESVARQYETTPAVVLLSCWQILLHRLSGRQEIVLGLVQQGRKYDGLEAALGLFAQTLPVSVQVPAHSTFVEVLGRAERATQDAAKWQEYFSWEEAGRDKGRQAGHGELAYQFEQAAVAPVRSAAGLRFSTLREQVCTAPFRLKLSCLSGGGALLTEWQYDAGRYTRADVERLGRQYLTLLAGLTRTPQARVCDVEVVGGKERQQLLVEWNDTGTRHQQLGCLHELFEQQAQRTPAAPALSFEGEELSYAELDARANQLAHHLRALGVGPESLVGVMLERSAEMVVAILAVLKAGGAYLPLDPEYPQERLSFMLADSGAQVLLTQSRLAARIAPVGEAVRVVALDDAELLSKQPADAVTVGGMTAENLAYVIYTSGSTGRPKGVMISHRSILNRLLWMVETGGFDASDRTLLKTSVSFDASVWELFVPLLSGGVLVVARPGGQQETRYLRDVVGQERVTTLQLVPSLLRAVLEEPELGAHWAGLRRLYCGGEALGADLAERLRREVPGAQVCNLYGPTEASIDATAWPLTSGETGEGRESEVVTLGRPIANVQVYVLDAGGRLLPAGAAGEIYVGGAGLARGYLRRAGLTAERFVPHPYSERGGERLYRTGDLGKWDAQGRLHYLGRTDQQVKVRGYRIELGEVEAALRSHPGVSAAVAAVREDGGSGPRLVAYVVNARQAALARLQQQENGHGGNGNGHAPAGLRQQLHRLPNGLEIAHLNKNETDILYKEIFADEGYLKHGVTLRDGDTVFDIGANIGLFTLFVHARYRGARTYSFEPIPVTCAALRRNVELYGLDAKVYESGVGREPGHATFTFYPQVSASSGMYADAAEEERVTRAFMGNQGEELAAHADELMAGRFAGERFECQLRTVSQVMREEGIERIDLLKVDVEKAELDVLEGIAEEDWAKIRQMVLEVHDRDGRLERVLEMLRRHGFQFVVDEEVLHVNTGLYNIYAIRPADGQGSSNGTTQAEAKQPPPMLLDTAPTVGDLRAHLGERLPEYMIPSHFVMLSKLPLMPNGKVDRKALPAPEQVRPELANEFVAPGTPLEEELAEIWKQVLAIGQVGVHDNFFELGGDSILCLQITARAGKQGIKLTPRQMFQHQTIAELAAVVEVAQPGQAESGLVTGPVPLTPSQSHFFERDLPEPHHFNQALMLEVKEALDAALLEKVVRHLLVHHDALRLRYQRGESGWRQVNAGLTAETPCARIDLSHVAEAEQPAAVERAAAEAQKSLDLADGPLFKVLLFDLGAGRPGRLLLVAHHLVIDGVSWRVLLDDLQAGYEQASRGEAIDFGLKTTSFRQWAEKLGAYAKSAAAAAELDYWLAEPGGPVARLPVDFPGGANTVASARTVMVALSAEETRALLQRVPAAYSTQINEVLLTALAQALAERTGERAVLLDLEGHGREEVVPDVDVSRTVGWFTSMFPVVLEVADGAGPGQALKAVKEQLRRVPNRGIGYGLLKYMGDAAAAERLRGRPRAELGFNYLGQFDAVLGEASRFAPARERVGAVSSPEGTLDHLLEINGGVRGGQLVMFWKFSANLFRQETVEGLAQSYIASLKALISHCQSAEAGGYTPSDFPLAKVDQQTLDALAGNDRNIEDIYPLSPLQRGLLFHLLYAPHSGIYFIQLNCTFVGRLDVAAFRQAWEALVSRHTILRTSFVWENLKEPLQIVRKQVELPWEERDWRGLSAEEQQAELAGLVEADRAQGFDAARAPLMRLLLVRFADDKYQFLWSTHHLLLDGWSGPVLMKEALAFYDAGHRGQEARLEPTPPYRHYIDWLQRQDTAKSEAYWRRTLAGFTAPNVLSLDRRAAATTPQEERYARYRTHLPEADLHNLRAFARRHQLTLNTMMQGAWSLLLRHYSGRDDVVFGAVVAGRPADLPGAETMVGVFINTLPVRVRIDAREELAAWLKRLQEQQAELRQYEYSQLVDVQSWSDVPRDQPLFETLLNFTNYPADDSLKKWEGPLRIEDFHFLEKANFPLAVVVNAHQRLDVEFKYDAGRFDEATVAHIMGQLSLILRAFVAQPVPSLDTLQEALAEADRRQQAARQDEFKTARRKMLESAKRSKGLSRSRS